jgi:hypothetical protein
MVNLNEDGVERRLLVWVVGVMDRKWEELHVSGKRERREGWRKVCHLIQKISFVVSSIKTLKLVKLLQVKKE